jgi:hypothetical protein
VWERCERNNIRITAFIGLWEATSSVPTSRFPAMLTYMHCTLQCLSMSDGALIASLRFPLCWEGEENVSSAIKNNCHQQLVT